MILRTTAQRIARALSLFLTIGLAIYLFADQEPVPSAAPRSAVKRVRVAVVETVTDSRELRFSGTTRAARRARLAFSLGGRLVARPVEIGDRVRAGQVLARLDGLELSNARATASATLAELAARRAQSERDRDRAERLLASKAATREELERSSAAVDAIRAAEDAAAARLRESERLLAETELRAPFDGTVTRVHFEPGEVAVAGQPVITLSGDGEVELEVEVPESVVGRIRIGDPVTISLPVLGGAAVSGQIKSVGLTTAGSGRLFPVVATLEHEGGAVGEGRIPRTGVTAELVLRLTSGDMLAVPVEAVVNPGGRRPSVFRVAEGGVVDKVAVDVESLLGNRVAVRGDLETGDRVVVGGQRGLLDGERVEVQR
ncbi:MAG: efflux RND transporter periplasmic adaptor subunit [Thermoanaerobaculia bacterium]